MSLLGGKPRVTEADVMKALSTVREPELGKDLVTLKMIEKLKVDGDTVSFTVILTTPACPLRHQMETESRVAVAKVPGVAKVNVSFESRVPHGRAQQGKQSIEGVRNVLAVASGKGGVGKSTVAVNLSVALAQTGANVGLLDADITGPNIPLMMGTYGDPVANGNKILPIEAHGVKVISIAFFVPPDQPVIWRGPMVGGAIQQFLRDVDWGELDYLVVDLPPGTGDASLSLAQLIPLAGALIVSTPQDVALLDASKSLAMFEKLEVPILGFVENMSYFVCSHCGERTEIFGFGGAEEAARRLDHPFLGRVPIDPEIRIGGDRGMPIVTSLPESPQSAAFRELASNVAARVSTLALSGAKRTTWIPLGVKA
jgi:ATP-binding protein involved in chromosome partitioning